MQFTFSRAGFDNAYYIFHKYYDAYSGEAYSVLAPPTLEFVNTGSLTTLRVRSRLPASEGREFTYTLFGEPLWRTDKQKDPDAGTRNVTQIFFNFSLYSVEEAGEDCADLAEVRELTEAVLATMNEKIKHTNYRSTRRRSWSWRASRPRATLPSRSSGSPRTCPRSARRWAEFVVSIAFHSSGASAASALRKRSFPRNWRASSTSPASRAIARLVSAASSVS